MPTSSEKRSAARRVCGLACAATLVLSSVAAVESAAGEAVQLQRRTSQASILILAADDFARPHVRLIFEGLNEVVSSTANAPAIYFESLDAARFEERDYFDGAREWLAHKYRERPIDLIIPVGEDAVGFLISTRGQPWPRAQVLFVEVGSVRFDIRRDLPTAGGLLLSDHSPAALATIKAVLPATRHLALVYGASEVDRLRWEGFAEKVRKAGFEPVVLAGTTAATLGARLSRLPAGTAIMLLAPTLDADGHVLSATETCRRVTAAGRLPAFTLGAHDLGCGVVGGLMRDWSMVGRMLGVEALARLERPSTAVVSVPIEKYTTLAFDDRQLARWGIPTHALPANAQVRFGEANLWRDHRATVLGVIAVTLLQSALIGGLVWEHRRRRKAEVDSRRHLAAIAHLDRRAAMGELATSLAHELNQPLNAILQNVGVAEMLMRSTPLPPALAELREILSDIGKDDKRASDVIRRMRGLLQKHELEALPVDLAELAHETADIVRPDARAREIQLEVTSAAHLAPVLGDRVHLQQVVLNLVLNAMDAVRTLPADRRQVQITLEPAGADVRLAVSDTGVGIPGDRLDEIFEPFFTTKPGSDGMGMGLAIARGIIEAHGGRVGAANNATTGATVWFTVPAAQRPRT